MFSKKLPILSHFQQLNSAGVKTESRKWKIAALFFGFASCTCTLGMGQSPYFSSRQTPILNYGSIVVPSATNSPARNVTGPISSAPVEHVGTGPIDFKNLPQDVLNCDVCRQRLGLPPWNRSSPSPKSIAPPNSQASPTIMMTVPENPKVPEAINPNTTNEATLQPIESIRTLGSPGLISSETAAQLATNGLVIEEFKPQLAKPDEIQLQGIPLEARQQFMRSLDLPFGARVLSAKIYDPNNPNPGANSATNLEPKTLGVPGILAAPKLEAKPESISPKPDLRSKTDEQSIQAEMDAVKQSNTQLQNELRKVVEEQIKKSEELQKKQLEVEQVAAAKIQLAEKERDAIVNQMRLLEDRQKQLQLETQQRLDQSDAANKEALAMLEKRTIEVTELQAAMSAQNELAKSKEQKEELEKKEMARKSGSQKKEKKKKVPGKNKDNHPKPTIDT